jgi:hypothetical protein
MREKSRRPWPKLDFPPRQNDDFRCASASASRAMGWASAGAWAYPTTEYGGLVFVYMGATRLQFDLGRPVQGSNKVHQAAGLSVECSIPPRPGLMPRQWSPAGTTSDVAGGHRRDEA